MDQIIFGDYTVKDLIIFTAILVGLWVLIKIFFKMFRKVPLGEYQQYVICNNCGWNGQVSKISGRCPQCNQPLGEQRARPLPRNSKK